ncbi:hypothetical protein ACJ72_04299 [Emergomyces africanus]|uniref:Uncharacterized protein n=1 Tax=Emergomyces africanus TaxID=1955775 RepID=A0A1B7NX65_9EURO|nr:hypothetical protein ACJ72_04299 [Emergomyces africanus]
MSLRQSQQQQPQQQQQQQKQQLPRHHQQQHQPQHMPTLSLGSPLNTSPFNNSASHLQPAHRTSGNASISMPNSHQNQNLERSYTPPSVLHQPRQCGISYSSDIVPSHSNHGLQQHGLPQIHQNQHPNQHQPQPRLHSRQSSRTHHRAYSQDSRQ